MQMAAWKSPWYCLNTTRYVSCRPFQQQPKKPWPAPGHAYFGTYFSTYFNTDYATIFRSVLSGNICHGKLGLTMKKTSLGILAGAIVVVGGGIWYLSHGGSDPAAAKAE